MTIAITGSTGQLGRLAIAALTRRGVTPIALARNPEKAADLGVEVRAFDYANPDVAALKGVTTLVLISSSSMEDRAGDHKRAVDAAKAAGVGHLVYTSVLKGDASPMMLAADHKTTEAHIKASGLPYTILRNGWYTENYTASLGGTVAAGAMIGAAGEGRVSAATRADYAEAIAAVVTGTGHVGKVYELAGDNAFTMTEMAAEVSRHAGKTIPYTSMPAEAYAAALQTYGMPASFATILADCDVAASNGALQDDSRTLSRLIGRPTTPMAETVKAALVG